MDNLKFYTIYVHMSVCVYIYIYIYIYIVGLLGTFSAD